MNSIELSRVQKSKLLDMCNKLFPKEKFNFIDKDGNLCEETIYDRSWFYLNKIHWFEFCTTHLFKKIFGSEDANEYTTGAIDITDYESHILSMYKNHPVDYLYKQFKKLKQQ